jgi:GNAT superfamily N-acetyltransferase
MTTLRQYQHPEDYERISEFLIKHYQPENLDGNWIEPAWEYMHFHPMLDKAILGKIGIWEDKGEIVAVVHYEWRLGEAFFQFHPAYRYLCAEMLDYSEKHLLGHDQKKGSMFLWAFVNDTDEAFGELVKERGYEKDPRHNRPMAKFTIPDPFPAIGLPDGFRLTSLAEDCNWAKVHRALWRGFNHEGEPPMTPEELEDRRRMFDTPKGRFDLKIAVEAPGGDFVAFCGMFYEPNGRYAYVEPVATDPDYRRLGLGKAAVLEGIRRCGELGARLAYVGSNLPFYQAIGFEVVYNSECWVKTWGG